jgi:hypothetical protein
LASNKYNLFGKAKDIGNYYKVTYSRNEIPALGGNGAALRREVLLRHAKADPDNFVHTDVVADLIRGGYNEYALVKDTIIHLTNNKVLFFLARRKYFIEKLRIKLSSLCTLFFHLPSWSLYGIRLKAFIGLEI